MLLLSDNFRKPTPPEAVLFGATLLGGSVDAAQVVNVGGVSGLGMGTMLVCGTAWAVWAKRPTLANRLVPVLLPLVGFEGYQAASMAWTPAAAKGLQLLAVGLAFVALVLLAAREVGRDRRFAATLHAALLAAGWVGTGLYLAEVAAGKAETADCLVNARSYALMVMVVSAVALARWRAGSRFALASAAVFAAALFLSLSRTALVVTLLMVPAAIALRGTLRSLAAAVLILAAGGAAFGVALATYPPLYARFFGHDASLAVGGVAINAEGRTRVWNMLLDGVGPDWFAGKGIASSEAVVEQVFGRWGLAQPHNDYIRFYYDGGLIAVGLWSAFVVAAVFHIAGDLRRAIRAGGGDPPLHVAALLAVVAVSASMATDNPVSYAFVMLPLGVVLGASLGAGQRAWNERRGFTVELAGVAAEAAAPVLHRGSLPTDTHGGDTPTQSQHRDGRLQRRPLPAGGG